MAQYRNESLGVVNVRGRFAAPGQTLEADSDTPGLDKLIDKGILSKVSKRGPKPKEERKEERKEQDDSEGQ